MNSNSIRIIIVNRGKDEAEAFAWEFRKFEEVETIHSSFEDIPHYDCVVTAGNSFGLMDAGIDLAVVKHFGVHVMNRVQERILDEYMGEQPVGTSFLVATDDPDHPFVGHTPTMRTPMNVDGTDNVYVATWASLLAVKRHNQNPDVRQVRTILLPGFCTGTGGVDPYEAARQMRIACEYFLKPIGRINPLIAQERQESVYYGGRWGFNNPRKDE